MVSKCDECGWELNDITRHQQVCRYRFGLELDNEHTLDITEATYKTIRKVPCDAFGDPKYELVEDENNNTLRFTANGILWRIILYKSTGPTSKLVLRAQIGRSDESNIKRTALGFNISLEVDDKSSLINRHTTCSSEKWSDIYGCFNVSLIKCALLKNKSFKVKISPTKQVIPRIEFENTDYRPIPDDALRVASRNAFSIYGPVYRYVDVNIDPEFQYLSSFPLETDDSQLSICSALDPEVIEVHETIAYPKSEKSISSKTKRKEKLVPEKFGFRRLKRHCGALENAARIRTDATSEFDQSLPDLVEKNHKNHKNTAAGTPVKNKSVGTEGEALIEYEDDNEPEIGNIEINIDAPVKNVARSYESTHRFRNLKEFHLNDGDHRFNNISPSMSPRHITSTTKAQKRKAIEENDDEADLIITKVIPFNFAQIQKEDHDSTFCSGIIDSPLMSPIQNSMTSSSRSSSNVVIVEQKNEIQLLKKKTEFLANKLKEERNKNALADEDEFQHQIVKEKCKELEQTIELKNKKIAALNDEIKTLRRGRAAVKSEVDE